MHVKTFATFGIAFALVAAACSSSSSSDNSGDGNTVDQDAGDQTDDDASTGSDSSTGTKTRVGDDCTKTGKCSTGQECVGISHNGGQAICMTTCNSKNPCANGDDCQNDICQPTCSDGCPSAMECISDINACLFDCDQNPKLCGSGEACLQSIECGAPVPDAGPLVCKSGGGTATSGVTGSKTVGSLTTTEQSTFCDWAAAVTGGYGCDGECDGGADVKFAASQSTCISQFTKSGCAATVSDVEACVKTNAANVCSLAVLSSPDCASLRACL